MEHLKDVLLNFEKEEIIAMFVNLAKEHGLDVEKTNTENPCCPPGSCGVCVDGKCIPCA